LPHGDAGAGELQVTVITDYYNHLFEYKTGVSHEAGEANNVGGPIHVTSTLALYPDLLVQNLHPDPADGLLSGSQVLLRWNTHNAGSAAVTGSFYERILVENLTTGSTLRSEVIFYDARTIPTGQGPIDANSSAARQYLYRLPDGPAGAGEIRLTVRTDHYNHLFEHNVDGTGETNNTAAVTVMAGLRNYPDLQVMQIDHPVSGLRPGQEIDISWLLANQGTGDTTGDWTDFVYLSDDDQVGNDLFLGQFNATGLAIPAGQSLLRTGRIMLPQFGTGDRWLIVQTDARNVLFESDETNNVTVSDAALQLPAALTLTFNRSTVAENAGSTAARGTVVRNGDRTDDLIVALTTSIPDRIGLPATVTIPAGQPSTTFDVAAIDNEIVDGTADLTVTATAAAYEPGTAPLQVTDDDVPTLTVTIAADTFAENAANPATTATVRRNTDRSEPLVVSLTSDLTSKATVPASVTIPTGQASFTFDVTAVNNTRIDGTGRATIRASAPGFQSVGDWVDVTDDDIPQLTVTFATARISENSPSPATIGTVTRSVVSDRELTVALTSLDTTEVQVPGGMRIPPGRASGTFAVYAVDDDLVDGLQTAGIMARIVTDSGVILNDGMAVANIEVADDDGPSLRLNFSRTVISERGSGTATVTRNTPPDADLIVTLESSDPGEAIVPASVTIRAGQTTSDPFTIQGVMDGEPTATSTSPSSPARRGSARRSVRSRSPTSICRTCGAIWWRSARPAG
jgi:hypothetical protein